MESQTKTTEHSVERHYGRTGIMESILTALQQNGFNTEHLQPEDLAPIDQFHVRGREGTAELADYLTWKKGMKVLDVGCGIGGPSRYLAATFGCDVTGIDLTPEFVDTAIGLTKLVGLDGRVRFRRGSATQLPFPDNTFDVVWTQHVQMNIKDKPRFYTELARVLKPGGRLLFHDVFRNDNSQPYYPVPWADEPSYSFLTTPEQARRIIEGLGLKVLDWEDTTQQSLSWMIQMREKARKANGPTLSPMVIMGETGRVKMENAARSLSEDRLRVIMGQAQK